MASNFESSQIKGSDTLLDYTCSACLNQKAQFYCEGCSKFYCDNCVKLHNQLFKHHPVFDKGQMDKWPITKSTLDILERCTDHRDEKIKLFCEDHGQLCCHICVALKHRQCSKVILVTESTKLPSTKDVRQLSSNIQKIQEQLKKQTDGTFRNLQSLEELYKQLKLEIEDLRQKINAALDQLETASFQELSDLIASYKFSITKERDDCISLQKDLQCLSDAVKEVCNKSNELLFIAFEKCQQQINHSELFHKDSKDTTEYCLEFVPNNDIEKNVSKLTGLGIICKPNKCISLQGKSEYSVYVPTESKSCKIVAICQLPSGETLVLDCNNNKVKLLDKVYKSVRNCDISSGSCDMCQISPRAVAVTVNESDGKTHRIQFISAQNGQLVKDEKMQLSHKCLGIAHHEADLYLTSGSALYHYTLTGTQLKKLYEDTSAGDTVYKCAVNLSGDKIYVTNNSHHKLLTLARDGTVMSSFSDLELQTPRGVHVTPGGQVLVCGGSCKTIIQVDTQGRRKIATVATEKDGLKDLETVHYTLTTDSVIVGFANNAILVFNVKYVVGD